MWLASFRTVRMTAASATIALSQTTTGTRPAAARTRRPRSLLSPARILGRDEEGTTRSADPSATSAATATTSVRGLAAAKALRRTRAVGSPAATAQSVAIAATTTMPAACGPRRRARPLSRRLTRAESSRAARRRSWTPRRRTAAAPTRNQRKTGFHGGSGNRTRVVFPSPPVRRHAASTSRQLGFRKRTCMWFSWFGYGVTTSRGPRRSVA